ncbi:dimethyladenosine transferase 2, mitochondrial [Erpetoichthys calabaricus]|uniref:rRNA adenine N(6)-methyltransferase n=1 Tax=Erpetoichthys calabaricus TaxID=27687 RepID=A0A8C4RDI4_ERPCA|nr:dimethyladenosine transferase 2, mitochondrial [Erpetoichthys calabaricus]
MLTHSTRQLTFAFRSCFCQTCGCPPFKAHTLLRPYSIEIPSVVGRTKKTQEKQKLEKSRSLQGLTQRNLSAVAGLLKGQYRPLSRFDFLDFGDLEEHTRKALACSSLRRFIINPDLAGLIAEKLDKDLSESHAVIFECNPGPGALTRALLNAGAQRIVALESDKTFLSDLQELKGRLDGQLDVMYCDFFRLDPISKGLPKPPIMHSEKLFNNLGIAEVPWIADIPIKVVGMLPQRNERNLLWRLIYALFECLSIFRYGRVEMNMFISENEYTKMTAQPGNMRHYQALSVLWQVACDIEVLHKEPWSSFVTSSKHGGLPKSMLPNDHLCLVRMTPCRNLFSNTLTTSNSAIFVMMVKQCLAKRKAKLIDRLDSWSPGSGEKLLEQLKLPHDILTGHVYPEQYKHLFEAMENSEEFTKSWLHDEILENTQKTGF